MAIIIILVYALAVATGDAAVTIIINAVSIKYLLITKIHKASAVTITASLTDIKPPVNKLAITPLK